MSYQSIFYNFHIILYQSIYLSSLSQGIEQLSEISLRHPVFIDAAGDGEGRDTRKKDGVLCVWRAETPDCWSLEFQLDGTIADNVGHTGRQIMYNYY